MTILISVSASRRITSLARENLKVSKNLSNIFFDDDDEGDEGKEKEEEMSQVKILTKQSCKIPHYSIITICAYLQILQNAAALITKYVGWIYYKMRTLLQNAAIIITK